MGMSVGPSSSGGGDPQVMSEINTTPLIDVMLVLLVMLIITIPIQLHSVDLNMPVGAPPSLDVKPEIVRIDLDENNVVYWNGEPLLSRDDLEQRMRNAAQQPVQPEIHVRPNKSAKYNTFVQVMISAQQIGLTKLGVIGSEQFVGK